MSASESPSPARFGRKPGPDAPRPVPFKKEMLPGITFVQACEGIGQYVIARTKRADDPAVYAAIRSESQDERENTCERVVRELASGKRKSPTGERPIGTTAADGTRYTARQTASAIVDALTFLDAENPAQAVRYRERIAGETDRALAQYRAGENPLGWTDGFLTESSPSVKRASDADIASARERKANRSGANAPTAVYRARGAAAQAREQAEAERAERARTRAAKPKPAKGAAKPAAEGVTPEAATVKAPRRPGRKGR